MFLLISHSVSFHMSKHRVMPIASEGLAVEAVAIWSESKSATS